ncbi:MAG: hypothetical protein H6599_06955 [Flavobacteriales bacterium]|nr:hypothetical protein [Flavobacteriales bacterium]
MKKRILFSFIGLFLLNVSSLAQKDSPGSTSYDSHTILNLLQIGIGSAEGLVSDGNNNYSDYSTKGNGSGIMAKMVFTIQTDAYMQFEAMGFLGQFLLGNTKGVYSNSMIEFGGGWTFNRQKPLKLGNVDMRFGLGMNGGARAFKAGDLTYNKVGSFGFFGPVIHSFTNIGDRFQIFNTNEFDGALVSTGGVMNSGGRMKFDFVCTYRITKKIGIALTPSFETFHHSVSNGDTEIGQSRYSYKYLQVGITFID